MFHGLIFTFLLALDYADEITMWFLALNYVAEITMCLNYTSEISMFNNNVVPSTTVLKKE